MKKSYFAAALAVTACMLMGAAAVSGQSKDVIATLRPDITLKINGTAYTVRDSKGNEVSPLLYDGTTYVPLAALGRMLDAEVTWDEETKTVSVRDQSTADDLIGEEKAKQIALDHAGVSASKATFLQVRLDWDDGRQEYEVEFWAGNTEYDYEIDAITGDIRGYDRDIENYEIPSSGQSGKYISQEKAKRLAQDRAPNATLVKIELDYDDGRAVYEGELRDGAWEYEFEIDAATGEFIKWEKDWDD